MGGCWLSAFAAADGIGDDGSTASGTVLQVVDHRGRPARSDFDVFAIVLLLRLQHGRRCQHACAARAAFRTERPLASCSSADARRMPRCSSAAIQQRKDA